MGEKATSDDHSKGSSRSRRRSRNDGSRGTPDQQPQTPPAKGHGQTVPQGTGIDRMAAQRRKERERRLGPATVDRMEADGDLDPDPSGFREAASAVAENLSPVGPDTKGSDDTAESGGDPGTVHRSVDEPTSVDGSSDDGTTAGRSSDDGTIAGRSGDDGGPVDRSTGGERAADGTSLRVHRFPGQGRLERAREAAAERFVGTGGNQVPTDLQGLASEVADLKSNQARIMSRVGGEGESTTGNDLAKAGGKGAIGAVAKPIGETGGMLTLGTLGAMVAGPAGAIPAAATGKQLGGAITADVAKRAYGAIHDEGAQRLQHAAEATTETAGELLNRGREKIGGLVSRESGNDPGTGERRRNYE